MSGEKSKVKNTVYTMIVFVGGKKKRTAESICNCLDTQKASLIRKTPNNMEIAAAGRWNSAAGGRRSEGNYSLLHMAVTFEC